MKIISRKWLIPSIMLLILLLISISYTMLTQPDLEYELLKIDQAPAAIYEVYESQKTTQAYSINSYDDSMYILITMGEVPSGGYSINIENVSTANQSLTIKTRFIEPDPTEMVITVISYPATVIKIPHSNQTIKVLANGKSLSQVY